MSNHTSAPWQVRVSNIVSVGVMEGNEQWQFSGIVQCMGPREVSEANAHHIVKCVNYHDRLVEALGLFVNYHAEDEGDLSIGDNDALWDKVNSLWNELAELSAHNGGEG